jgi:kynureninase
MNPVTDRRTCAAWDAEDPLAFARERFVLPQGVIYLDGNSLGPLPRDAFARLAQVTAREWGEHLITSWNLNGWIDLPARVGEKIAPLVGAAPGQVIVTDSTSVNLFKCAAAALAMRPGRRAIVATRGDFPTDLHILQGLREALGDVELRFVEEDGIEAALEGAALLLLTHVHYRTGRIRDMAELVRRAHAAGVLTLWDLSHSAGVIEVALDACRADFAVGCGYKFLNGGPGAPAFVYVAERHQAAVRQPLSGWLGHARPFDFVDAYEPAPGVNRMLCGTPPVLSLAALETGIDTFDGVDMAAVRAKAGRLGDLFIALVEQRLPGAGFELASPREASARGGQVSFRHPEAYPVVQALIERGVIGDFRAPDVARFGFAPLYVRFVDVWDAVQRLVEVMQAEAWRDPRWAARKAVT